MTDDQNASSGPAQMQIYAAENGGWIVREAGEAMGFGSGEFRKLLAALTNTNDLLIWLAENLPGVDGVFLPSEESPVPIDMMPGTALLRHECDATRLRDWQWSEDQMQRIKALNRGSIEPNKITP